MANRVWYCLPKGMDSGLPLRAMWTETQQNQRSSDTSNYELCVSISMYMRAFGPPSALCVGSRENRSAFARVGKKPAYPVRQDLRSMS